MTASAGPEARAATLVSQRWTLAFIEFAYMLRFLRYLCAPMVGQQRLLASDLAPTVLAARIRAHLKSGTWIGWETADGFWLTPPIGGRNSWRPIFQFKLEGVAGGTRVPVRVAVHPAVRAFMYAWHGFLAVGALAASLVSLFLSVSGFLSNQPQAGLVLPLIAVPFIVIPLTMMALGGKLSNWAFQRDLPRGWELLETTLHA